MGVGVGTIRSEIFCLSDKGIILTARKAFKECDIETLASLLKVLTVRFFRFATNRLVSDSWSEVKKAIKYQGLAKKMRDFDELIMTITESQEARDARGAYRDMVIRFEQLGSIMSGFEGTVSELAKFAVTISLPGVKRALHNLKREDGLVSLRTFLRWLGKSANEMVLQDMEDLALICRMDGIVWKEVNGKKKRMVRVMSGARLRSLNL